MIKVEDKYFNLKIIRKHNKNIYLRIKGDTIEVTCPYWAGKEEIINFVLSKSDWIDKTVNKNEDRKERSKILIGDCIYYLGKQYRFIYLKGKDDFKVVGDSAVVYCNSGEIEDAIKVFYKEGIKKLRELIYLKQDKYLNIIEDYGYDLIPDYKFKILKSAWGINYTKKNLIMINERLIHFEDRCLEAILWHELLHFVIPNHSKRFHEVLDYHMPDYKKLVKSLY